MLCQPAMITCCCRHRKRKKLDNVCRVSAVSCSQFSFTLEPSNGLCNTRDDVHVSHHCRCHVKCTDRKQVVCKYGMWMVCGSNTPPNEGTNFLHLGVFALCQLTLQKLRNVKSTLSKTVRTRPLEMSICWEKVSTSSSSVSMSFIFLAIMDTWPTRTSAQADATIGWISGRTRVHLAESDYKSNTKLCFCILKTAKTMHDVLHIQTLCNSENCSKNCANCSILH